MPLARRQTTARAATTGIGTCDTPRRIVRACLAQGGPRHRQHAHAQQRLDLQRRAASKAEKESKLKSPNFFVSDTRLSVHNLPLKTDDKALKKIFMDAVQRRATKEVPVVKQAKVLRYVRAGIRSLS